MSLDLSIKINKKIETQKFLLDIQYLFQKLLEMNESIEIIIQEIKNKDHSCFWVDKPVNSPKDFYEYLKNDKKFQLYVAQAKYHYDWRDKKNF